MDEPDVVDLTEESPQTVLRKKMKGKLRNLKALLQQKDDPAKRVDAEAELPKCLAKLAKEVTPAELATLVPDGVVDYEELFFVANMSFVAAGNPWPDKVLADILLLFSRLLSFPYDAKPALFIAMHVDICLWVELIVPLLSSGSDLVRAEAIALLELVRGSLPNIMCARLDRWQKVEQVLTKNIGCIANLLSAQNPDWAKVWKIFLHIIGSELTQKNCRQFFNKLLRIVSLKDSYKTPAMKLHSLECWQLLIHYFFRTTDAEQLPSNHTGLILKYFQNNDTATEVLEAKMKVLWYFMYKLPTNHITFEPTLKRFFELFFFVPRTHSVLTLLPELGSEILALLFGCHLNDAIPDFGSALPLPKSTIITPKLSHLHLLKFISYYEHLFKSQVLKAATPKVSRLLHLTWSELLRIITDCHNPELVNALLKMVPTCFESAVKSGNAVMTDSCVTLLVSGIVAGQNPLPDSILASGKFYSGSTQQDLVYGTPVSFLTSLVVRSCVIKADNQKDFLPTLESLVRKGLRTEDTTHYYASKILCMMVDIARDAELVDTYPHVLQIWSLVSRNLSECLEKNDKQAQEKSDLYWLYDVILFPILYYYEAHCQIIVSAISSLKPLMSAVHKSSYKIEMEFNEICEVLSSKLIKLLDDDPQRRLVIALAMEMFVTTIPYEDMFKNYSHTRFSFANLTSTVELLVKVSSAICLKQSTPLAALVKPVCNALNVLAGNLNAKCDLLCVLEPVVVSLLEIKVTRDLDALIQATYEVLIDKLLEERSSQDSKLGANVAKRLLNTYKTRARKRVKNRSEKSSQLMASIENVLYSPVAGMPLQPTGIVTNLASTPRMVGENEDFDKGLQTPTLSPAMDKAIANHTETPKKRNKLQIDQAQVSENLPACNQVTPPALKRITPKLISRKSSRSERMSSMSTVGNAAQTECSSNSVANELVMVPGKVVTTVGKNKRTLEIASAPNKRVCSVSLGNIEVPAGSNVTAEIPSDISSVETVSAVVAPPEFMTTRRQSVRRGPALGPLTKHQLEKMRERRDNIPAMYTGLTQDSQLDSQLGESTLDTVSVNIPERFKNNVPVPEKNLGTGVEPEVARPFAEIFQGPSVALSDSSKKDISEPQAKKVKVYDIFKNAKLEKLVPIQQKKVLPQTLKADLFITPTEQNPSVKDVALSPNRPFQAFASPKFKHNALEDVLPISDGKKLYKKKKQLKKLLHDSREDNLFSASGVAPLSDAKLSFLKKIEKSAGFGKQRVGSVFSDVPSAPFIRADSNLTLANQNEEPADKPRAQLPDTDFSQDVIDSSQELPSKTLQTVFLNRTTKPLSPIKVQTNGLEVNSRVPVVNVSPLKTSSSSRPELSVRKSSGRKTPKVKESDFEWTYVPPIRKRKRSESPSCLTRIDEHCPSTDSGSTDPSKLDCELQNMVSQPINTNDELSNGDAEMSDIAVEQARTKQKRREIRNLKSNLVLKEVLGKRARLSSVRLKGDQSVNVCDSDSNLSDVSVRSQTEIPAKKRRKRSVVKANNLNSDDSVASNCPPSQYEDKSISSRLSPVFEDGACHLSRGNADKEGSGTLSSMPVTRKQNQNLDSMLNSQEDLVTSQTLTRDHDHSDFDTSMPDTKMRKKPGRKARKQNQNIELTATSADIVVPTQASSNDHDYAIGTSISDIRKTRKQNQVADLTVPVEEGLAVSEASQNDHDYSHISHIPEPGCNKTSGKNTRKSNTDKEPALLNEEVLEESQRSQVDGDYSVDSSNSSTGIPKKAGRKLRKSNQIMDFAVLSEEALVTSQACKSNNYYSVESSLSDTGIHKKLDEDYSVISQQIKPNEADPDTVHSRRRPNSQKKKLCESLFQFETPGDVETSTKLSESKNSVVGTSSEVAKPHRRQSKKYFNLESENFTNTSDESGKSTSVPSDSFLGSSENEKETSNINASAGCEVTEKDLDKHAHEVPIVKLIQIKSKQLPVPVPVETGTESVESVVVRKSQRTRCNALSLELDANGVSNDMDCVPVTHSPPQTVVLPNAELSTDKVPIMSQDSIVPCSQPDMARIESMVSPTKRDQGANNLLTSPRSVLDKQLYSPTSRLRLHYKKPLNKIDERIPETTLLKSQPQCVQDVSVKDDACETNTELDTLGKVQSTTEPESSVSLISKDLQSTPTRVSGQCANSKFEKSKSKQENVEDVTMVPETQSPDTVVAISETPSPISPVQSKEMSEPRLARRVLEKHFSLVEDEQPVDLETVISTSRIDAVEFVATSSPANIDGKLACLKNPGVEDDAETIENIRLHVLNPITPDEKGSEEDSVAEVSGNQESTSIPEGLSVPTLHDTSVPSTSSGLMEKGSPSELRALPRKRIQPTMISSRAKLMLDMVAKTCKPPAENHVHVVETRRDEPFRGIMNKVYTRNADGTRVASDWVRSTYCENPIFSPPILKQPNSVKCRSEKHIHFPEEPVTKELFFEKIVPSPPHKLRSRAKQGNMWHGPLTAPEEEFVVKSLVSASAKIGDCQEHEGIHVSVDISESCLDSTNLTNESQSTSVDMDVSPTTEAMQKEDSVKDDRDSDENSFDLGTPASLELDASEFLNDTEHMYPSLIHCKNSLSEIALKLTSSRWKEMFLRQAQRGGISTVGDLCSRSEREINRLPIKGNRKCWTLKKVLMKYEKKLLKEADRVDDSGQAAVTSSEEFAESLLKQSNINEILRRVLNAPGVLDNYLESVQRPSASSDVSEIVDSQNLDDRWMSLSASVKNSGKICDQSPKCSEQSSVDISTTCTLPIETQVNNVCDSFNRPEVVSQVTDRLLALKDTETLVMDMKNAGKLDGQVSTKLICDELDRKEHALYVSTNNILSVFDQAENVCNEMNSKPELVTRVLGSVLENVNESGLIYALKETGKFRDTKVICELVNKQNLLAYVRDNDLVPIENQLDNVCNAMKSCTQVRDTVINHVWSSVDATRLLEQIKLTLETTDVQVVCDMLDQSELLNHMVDMLKTPNDPTDAAVRTSVVEKLLDTVGLKELVSTFVNGASIDTVPVVDIMEVTRCFVNLLPCDKQTELMKNLNSDKIAVADILELANYFINILPLDKMRELILSYLTVSSTAFTRL